MIRAEKRKTLVEIIMERMMFVVTKDMKEWIMEERDKSVRAQVMTKMATIVEILMSKMANNTMEEEKTGLHQRHGSRPNRSDGPRPCPKKSSGLITTLPQVPASSFPLLLTPLLRLRWPTHCDRVLGFHVTVMTPPP